MAVPFCATASIVEGTSTNDGDASLVKIWYRCNNVECEFEADLDQQLKSEAIEFHWEFNDGNTLITSDPFVNYIWEIDGEKNIKLSVYDQYCELNYAEADFDLQTPSLNSDIADDNGDANEGDIADQDDVAGEEDVSSEEDVSGEDDATGEDDVADQDGASDEGDVAEQGDVADQEKQVNTLTSALVLVGQDTLRSASEPLQNVQVRGDTYIYIEALPNARQVSFSLSNDSSEKVRSKLERSAPYDLAGGSALEAIPFNTRSLEDGRYHLDITASYLDGRIEYLTVSFDILNASPVAQPEVDDADELADVGENTEADEVADGGEVADDSEGESGDLTSTQLRIAQNKSRTESEPLDGYQVHGDAFIFIDDVQNAKQVSFALFSQESEKVVDHLERYAPYDLVGGSSEEANPFDTRSLDDGSYRLDVIVTKIDNSVHDLTANFTVFNTAVDVAPSPGTVSGVTDIADVVDASDDVVVGGDDENENLTITKVRIGQNSSRVDSEPLEGYQVQGDAYIFVNDLTDAKQVSFTLYDQASERVSRRVERSAPYDLVGGSTLEASPLATRSLEDGSYSLDVNVDYYENRTEQLTVQFYVFNATTVSQPVLVPDVDIVENDDDAGPSVGAAQPEDFTGQYNTNSELVFSTRSNRSNSSELAGAILEGNTYIYLTGVEEADVVEFFVDDIFMDEAPMTVERFTPWDASGGSVSRARPLSTRNLENGQHVLSVRIVEGDQSHVVHASFSVEN